MSGDCPIFEVVSNILVPEVFLVSHSLALCGSRVDQTVGEFPEAKIR